MALKHELCGRCGKQVYHAEKKVAINKVWHQFCFNCVVCHKLLNPSNFSTHKGELYCQQCYFEANSYEIDFVGKNKSNQKISKHSNLSSQSEEEEEDINSLVKRSEIIESSNLRPSEIKSTLRKRRKTVQPNEENINRLNSLEKRNRSNEDTIPAQFYNKKRRNAICEWDCPFRTKEDTCSKYCTGITKEESEDILNETTHSKFPRRSFNKNTFKDDFNQNKTTKAKRRKSVSTEEQEDSAYETEHNIPNKKTFYKKMLPSFLCDKDCIYSKNAAYSELVYEESKISSSKNEDNNSKNKPQNKPEKQSNEEMSETTKTDSLKIQKNDKSFTQNQKEEIIFISESGTTKIVKITTLKTMKNGAKELKKSETIKDKNLDDLKNNKTSDSYINEDTTCIVNDITKKMKNGNESSMQTGNEDQLKQEKKKENVNTCDKLTCNFLNKSKKNEAKDEDIELKRSVGKEKLPVYEDNEYKTTKKEKSKKDKKNNEEDRKTCDKTACNNFNKMTQHQREDLLEKPVVKNKNSPQKMKKSKIEDEDKIDESLYKSIIKDGEDTIYTNKDTPKKMKKPAKKTKKGEDNSDESLYKTANDEKNTPQKLKKSKPCTNSTCQTDSRSSSQKIKKRKSNEDSLYKTIEEDTLALPETPVKKNTSPIFNKFWKKTKEDVPNADKQNLKKHQDKSKSEYSNDSTHSPERRSSLKKISNKEKTKSQLSFEDQSKPHKPSKLTKKKPKEVVSSKEKDYLNGSNNKSSKSKKKRYEKKDDSVSSISSDNISIVPNDYSKSKSDKKAENNKKKDSFFNKSSKNKNKQDDTTLVKSKKDKQNKSKSKNESILKTADESIQKELLNKETFSPVFHSSPKSKKKPKQKGDDFASVDDFFKPIPYSNPKGDHIIRKKKHEDDETEEILDKTKEVSKKNKKTDKSKEKHKKTEETKESPNKNKTEEDSSKQKRDKLNKKQDKINKETLDETEDLIKTKESPKNNKNANKTKEKTPEKKKACKNPNCRNKPRTEDKTDKENTTLYETAISSPTKDFFSFSSKKEDSYQTAGGTPDKTKHQSSKDKNKTKHFEDTTKNVSSKRSSREKKTLQSKPDDLGSIEDLFQPMKQDKKKDNTSEEELFTTAYNIFPSSTQNRNTQCQTTKPINKSLNRRNKFNYDEIPSHTALKYPNDKEDLFLKIKSSKKRLTFDNEVFSSMQFFKPPRQSSLKKCTNRDSNQNIKKTNSSRNTDRRKSSGECKITNSLSRCNQLTNRKNDANKLHKKTSKIIQIPVNKRNIEDVFKSSFAKNILESGKQENRDSLLQKLRRKFFSHYKTRSEELKQNIVCRRSCPTKKTMRQNAKQTVYNSSETSCNSIIRAGNGLYNRSKVVDRIYETYLPDENQEVKKEFCRRCSKKVYVVEQKFAANGIFHNRCFCCYICQKHLDSLNIVPRKGEIFCKQCYMKYYGPHIYGYGMNPNLHFN